MQEGQGSSSGPSHGAGWKLTSFWQTLLIAAVHLALSSAAFGQEDTPKDSESTKKKLKNPPTPQPSSDPKVAEQSEPAEQGLSAEQRILQLEQQMKAQKAEFELRLEQLEGGAEGAALSQKETPDADAEADALLDELLGEEVPEAEDTELSLDAPPVRVYGFMDAGYQRAWGTLISSGISETAAGTFVLGNVNTYFDAQPHPEWRALTEVRFTLLPHGSSSVDQVALGDFSPVSTEVLDPASNSGGFTSVNWNGVILERAHIDWTPMDELNLRVGYFLTPVGIFNIDHGTPARMLMAPPVFLLEQLFPVRQLGVEAFGRFHMLPWQLKWHLYLSNGRTVGQVDLSDNKAIGGRLVLARRRPFTLELGTSFFIGGDDVDERSVIVDADADLGSFNIERKKTVESFEYSLAADVTVKSGPWTLNAEGAINRIEYTDGLRGRGFVGQPADSLDWAWYVAFGHRFSFDVEPVFFTEWISTPSPVNDTFLVPGAGVNIYPSPVSAWKFEYRRAGTVNLHDTSDIETDQVTLHYIGTRLTIAF